MYVIIEDGSRQYRAEVGGFITIDHRECEAGQTLELTNVLLVSDGAGKTTIGRPTVTGAKVLAEVVDFPSVKTQAQLFRRRKNIRRLRGHRQPHVRVKVTQIVAG